MQTCLFKEIKRAYGNSRYLSTVGYLCLHDEVYGIFLRNRLDCHSDSIHKTSFNYPGQGCGRRHGARI